MNEKVKQALENVKNIKVGCMVLNDLFGEELSIIEKALNNYEESEKELVVEQHRLFDLAKEQENELNELKEFAKVLCKMKIVDSNHKIYGINDAEFDLIKKVVEKYGEQANR